MKKLIYILTIIVLTSCHQDNPQPNCDDECLCGDVVHYDIRTTSVTTGQSDDLIEWVDFTLKNQCSGNDTVVRHYEIFNDTNWDNQCLEICW